MDILKKYLYTILLISAFSTFMIIFAQQMCELYMVGQGREKLKQDAYVLSTILEQENCLSLDTVNGTSKYADFVNNTLRTSETGTFKYDVEVTRTGRVQNNSELGNSWNGADNEHCAIQIDLANTSYATCPQQGEVVTATLYMNVYTPSIVGALVDHNDQYALSHSRMKETISQEIQVIGFKYYKGKG